MPTVSVFRNGGCSEWRANPQHRGYSQLWRNVEMQHFVIALDHYPVIQRQLCIMSECFERVTLCVV